MNSDSSPAPVSSRQDHGARPGFSTDISSLRSWLTCIGLAVAVLLIYGQVFDFKFVNFDDDVHVTENPYVVTGLTAENIVWDFGIHGPSQWHPLAWLSHQLDCTWYGLQPGGHHATNVALHLTTSILMFLTLQRLLNGWGIAAFTAAAFAVHPLNVESVAWVSERRNVLCGVFFVLAIRCYLGYVKRPTSLAYNTVLICHAAALMSKPLAVTLPCVLLLLDFWPLRRSSIDLQNHLPKASLAKLLLEKLPLIVMSGVASYLTILCQRAVGTIATFDAISLPLRLTNSVAAYGWYLLKVFAPWGLGAFYPHPAIVDPDPWSQLLLPATYSGVALVLVSILVVGTHRKYPGLWLGWLWFLGMMVPMIGVMQVGEQQQADRYAYLPVVGLFLLLGSFGRLLIQRLPHSKLVVYLASFSMLLGWGLTAYQQTSYWKNSVTLFSHTIDVTERNHWAHNNLGYAYLKQGKFKDAATQFNLAIQAVPGYALAHCNLGVALDELGHLDAARRELETSLQLDPTSVLAHQRLAAVLVRLDDLPLAVTHFQQAATLAPKDSLAQFNLGLALLKAGRATEAVHPLNIAHTLHPKHPESVIALAMALRDAGQTANAIRILKAFIAENPNARAESLLQEIGQQP